MISFLEQWKHFIYRYNVVLNNSEESIIHFGFADSNKARFLKVGQDNSYTVWLILSSKTSQSSHHKSSLVGCATLFTTIVIRRLPNCGLLKFNLFKRSSFGISILNGRTLQGRTAKIFAINVSLTNQKPRSITKSISHFSFGTTYALI